MDSEDEMLPIELLGSVEALKRIYCRLLGDSMQGLSDLKILAVYRTPTEGFMIAQFLMGSYQLVFLGKYWDYESVSLRNSESEARYQAETIAKIAGAALIDFEYLTISPPKRLMAAFRLSCSFLTVPQMEAFALHFGSQTLTATAISKRVLDFLSVTGYPINPLYVSTIIDALKREAR